MPRRNDVLGVTGAETMIGSGVVVNGNLTSEGDIFIDGTVTGTIKASTDVTIGVNAVIRASITGDNVKIGGEVTGNVLAEGEVTISESGQLRGNVQSGGLTIVSGGVFNGTSKVRQTISPLDTPSLRDTPGQQG
jgi:cytoskeletal protein CcmA (bactofilin family)